MFFQGNKIIKIMLKKTISFSWSKMIPLNVQLYRLLKKKILVVIVFFEFKGDIGKFRFENQTFFLIRI